MLATDTTFEVLTCLTTLLNTHLDELTNTLLIENLEWIDIQNLLFKITWEEACDVITAVTEGHLGKVVSTKAEVFCLLCNDISCQSSTRNLNHCTNLEWNFNTFLLEELCCCLTNDALLDIKLIDNTNQWYHNLWLRVISFSLQLDSCTKDSLGLHGCNLWECVAQTTTTKTQHWVVLGERIHTTLNELYAHAHLLSHDLLTFQVMWNELMQWWIKQTDVYWHAIHALENTVEVLLLVRKELIKSLLTLLCGISKNHLAHRFDLLILEEHVLCTAKTNTYGTEVTCHFCVMRRICVGTYNQFSVFLTEIHQLSKVTCHFCRACLYFSSINFTC